MHAGDRRKPSGYTLPGKNFVNTIRSNQSSRPLGPGWR